MESELYLRLARGIALIGKQEHAQNNITKETDRPAFITTDKCAHILVAYFPLPHSS